MSVVRLFDLGGTHAVVTGGARGIGAATATLLREAGAHVEVLDLETGCDVTDEAQVKRAFERVGEVDILVNNAGRAARKPALELTVEEWDAVLDLNLRAVFVCSRTAHPFMKRRGGGAIVLRVLRLLLHVVDAVGDLAVLGGGQLHLADFRGGA